MNGCGWWVGSLRDVFNRPVTVAACYGEWVDQGVDSERHAREPQISRHKIVDDVPCFLVLFHFLLFCEGSNSAAARLRYDRRISLRVHSNRFSRPCKYSCLPKSHLLSDTKSVKNDEKNATKRPLHRKTGLILVKRGRGVNAKCKMQNAKLWMSDGRCRRKSESTISPAWQRIAFLTKICSAFPTYYINKKKIPKNPLTNIK